MNCAVVNDNFILNMSEVVSRDFQTSCIGIFVLIILSHFLLQNDLSHGHEQLILLRPPIPYTSVTSAALSHPSSFKNYFYSL